MALYQSYCKMDYKAGFRNNIFDLLLIVIIVSFIIIVYRELKTVTVLIEPFDVPKNLRKRAIMVVS